MNVVIIEDEVQTAWDVQHCLRMARPHFHIQVVLDSVESGIEWFAAHATPDLIFSDIQLGDGLAFEIFRKTGLACPVIFCTAYDQYAIQAFDCNGIDYILKPVNEGALEKSLAKVEGLLKTFHSLSITRLETLIHTFLPQEKSYKSTFLVSYRNQLIPIHVDDIAYFCVTKDGTELWTRDKRVYFVHKSLDQLQTVIDPQKFYRVNRQFLLSYKVIQHVEHSYDRKLLVKISQPVTEPIFISKEKASDFLHWIEAR